MTHTVHTYSISSFSPQHTQSTIIRGHRGKKSSSSSSNSTPHPTPTATLTRTSFRVVRKHVRGHGVKWRRG
jgi:hypothetical protein